MKHILRLLVGIAAITVFVVLIWIAARNPTVADTAQLVVQGVITLGTAYFLGAAIIWLFKENPK